MDWAASTLVHHASGVNVWAMCRPHSPEDQTQTWAVALRFKPEDLVYLKCEHVGWLLHTMLCITGVLGYIEQAVERGDGGEWARVPNETKVLSQAHYRYVAQLNRTSSVGVASAVYS